MAASKRDLAVEATSNDGAFHPRRFSCTNWASVVVQSLVIALDLVCILWVVIEHGFPQDNTRRIGIATILAVSTGIAAMIPLSIPVFRNGFDTWLFRRAFVNATVSKHAARHKAMNGLSAVILSNTFSCIFLFPYVMHVVCHELYDSDRALWWQVMVISAVLELLIETTIARRGCGDSESLTDSEALQLSVVGGCMATLRSERGLRRCRDPPGAVANVCGARRSRTRAAVQQSQCRRVTRWPPRRRQCHHAAVAGSTGAVGA